MNSDHPLVSCQWLDQHRLDSNLVVLDCTFFLPNQGRDSFGEYRSQHLPSARFFDIDKIADTDNPLPHMLPNPDGFADAVGRLGIDNDTMVVAYDNNSFMASARAWWMFRTFGHSNVYVLDGGIKRWKSQGGTVDSAQVNSSIKTFRPTFHGDLVFDLDRMKTAMDSDSHQILDARSPQRFGGHEPEPRAGLRSGHIPGSINVHYNQLVDAESGELKSPEKLMTLLSASRVNDKKPIVSTCGSGVTASIIALALYCIGNHTVAVYDGSWAEWGSRPDLPLETD